jgi:hypothetical protein
MRLSKISLVIAAALLIAGSPSAHADEASDRAAKAAGIAARWNPIFDAQQLRIDAMAASAKKDKETLKQYNALVPDFAEVRRVINEGLRSATSDLDAVSGYAEEETGEFASTIPALEKLIASIKTISCVKGKTVKKVTGLTPKCPAGYKKK